MVTAGLLTIVLSLSGQAEPDPEVPSVLVLDLDAARIDPDEARVMNDLVGQSVTRKPVKVTTAADVRRMADVESQKSLLGCETDSSCLADLAGDFGARYVLYGSVAELGELYVIQLTLFDGERAEALERVRVETRDLAEITAQIDDAVDRVFVPVLGAAPAPDAGIPTSLWVIGGGAAVAVVGLGLVGGSALPAGAHNELQAEIGALEQDFVAGDEAALSEAAEKQRRAADEAVAHLVLLGSGLALTLVGAGVMATGLVMEE